MTRSTRKTPVDIQPPVKDLDDKTVGVDPEATPAEAPAGETTRDEALRLSYATATKQLREEQATRFNELRVADMKARGFEWTPPPSAEQKAQAELDRLIAENPGLESVLRERFFGGDSGVPDPSGSEG